jgi:hypothetical protein
VALHNFVPAAHARNFFGKELKNSESTWTCMIDNDMQLPENLIDTVKDAPADADIVVPEFYMWNQNDLKLTLCWGMQDCPSGIRQKLDPGFHELTKCGTGVIFIKPRVFKGMRQPYFSYKYNEDGGMIGTEDIEFCTHARELGFKIYGNTRIKVGHIHSIELGSMWQWYEKVLANNQKVAISNLQQDSGRSPDSSAKASSA